MRGSAHPPRPSCPRWRAPRLRSQVAVSGSPARSAASRGVRSSQPTRLTSAPASRSSAAVSRCPPWQAAHRSASRSWAPYHHSRDVVGQAERGRVPRRHRGTALDEPPSGIPLGEGRGVVQRRAAADHRTVGVDVGPGVEQRVDRLDVVGARRPVQWPLPVRPDEGGLDVGAVAHEHRDAPRDVRQVARPVARDVQQGPPAVPGQPRRREARQSGEGLREGAVSPDRTARTAVSSTASTARAQMPRIWWIRSARARVRRSWGSLVNGPSIRSSLAMR